MLMVVKEWLSATEVCQTTLDGVTTSVFLSMMQNQCVDSKKYMYQATVNQFADFLVQYAQHNRAKAADIIFKHLETLRYACRFIAIYSNQG